MSDKFVTIASYRNAIDAHLAKTLLESEDIECILENEEINWIYSGVFYVFLLVKEKDAEAALAIINDK